MFVAILFVNDDSACATMESLAIESKQVIIQKTLNRYPPAFELSQLLNIHEPDLILLDLSDRTSALAAAGDIRELAPRLPIIGFGAGWEPRSEKECLASGIAELMVSPVTLKKFQDCVDRAIHKKGGEVQENLLAFLPAKAGSGCTTVAFNVAGYLADTSGPDPLGKKVLLIEGDLHSGVVSVLLNSNHPFSVIDALQNSGHLDYSLWTKYVARFHNTDFLLANPTKKALPSWSNYHDLLDFAKSRYDHILVDLPEVVNDGTVEIVRRAKRVFVVCTPELPSLALASQRCEELTGRGIPAEKIGVILNRWHRGEISANDLEELMKCSVPAVFENDYPTVCKAAREHRFVSRSTKLGKSLDAFARKLAGGSPVPKDSKLGFLKGLAKATPQLRP